MWKDSATLPRAHLKDGWDCVTLSHHNPNYYTGWRMEKDRYIFQPPVSFFEVAAGVGVIVLVLGVSVIVWRENWMKLLSRSRNAKSSLSKLGWIVLITVFMKQVQCSFVFTLSYNLIGDCSLIRAQIGSRNVQLITDRAAPAGMGKVGGGLLVILWTQQVFGSLSHKIFQISD